MRHATNLAQESEIKLKKYEGLNGDGPSVMQISSIPPSEAMAIQGKNGQIGNTQNVT